MELIDTLGQTNYTIALKDTANAPYVFHNLVIGKTADGHFKRPYVVTYTMSEAFREEYDRTQSIADFEGGITMRYLKDGLSGSKRGSANIDSERGVIDNNDPCNRDISPPSPTGGGGGGDFTLPPPPDYQFKWVCDWEWIDFETTSDGIWYDANGILTVGVSAKKSILSWECGFEQSSSVVSGSDPCNPKDEIAVIDPNKPCPGDPVKNPEIAAQPEKASGKPGGLFSDKFRKESINGALVSKIHAGLDVKANPGDPIYSMTSGTVTFIDRIGKGKLGHYVTVTFLLNGESHSVLYAHLQAQNLPKVNEKINTGDIIGISGNSGNIVGSKGEHHVHIELWKGAYTWNKNEKRNLKRSRPNHLDPRIIMGTKFDENLEPIKNNCN